MKKRSESWAIRWNHKKQEQPALQGEAQQELHVVPALGQLTTKVYAQGKRWSVMAMGLWGTLKAPRHAEGSQQEGKRKKKEPIT